MKRVFAALLAAGTLLLSAQTVPSGALLHARRELPTDLEVVGLAGVPAGTGQFLSYQTLLQLPQISFVPVGDSNYPASTTVSGVALDQIARKLGSDADMVVAMCADGYRSNYPAAYLAAHHPVLVLTVNGKQPQDWPKVHGGEPLGPYVIANPAFVPSFKVLAHTDEAQIPFQVVRLDFRSEKQVLGAIAPHGTFADGSPVMNGYRIAQQNCYRCHNMGDEGGHMAGLSWPVLGMMAKSNPDFFAKYVRNPQAINPNSHMAASPGYDDATMAALEAYFSTFAAGGQ